MYLCLVLFWMIILLKLFGSVVHTGEVPAVLTSG
jgi:hypothetical protein